MKRILLFSTLAFFLFSPLAEAEDKNTVNVTDKDRKFLAYSIQSFGWECEKISHNYQVDRAFVKLEKNLGLLGIAKITCDGGRTYYWRIFKETFIICNEGKCKNLWK